MLTAFMKTLRIICILLVSSFNLCAAPISNTYSLKQLLPRVKPAARTAILISLSKAYEMEGNTDLAIDYLSKALNLFVQLKNDRGMADCQADLGVLLLKKKQYSPSKAAYVKALKNYDRLQDKKSMINVMRNIGILEEAIAQNDSASLYYRKGIALASELGDSSAAVSLYINFGNLLVQTGKFSDAKSMLARGIALADRSETSDEQIRGRQVMSNLIYKQGNYKDAFNYLKRLTHFSDSISNIRNRQAIAAAEAKIETEQTEAKLQNSQQGNISGSYPFMRSALGIILLMILAIIAGIISAVFYFRRKSNDRNAVLLSEKDNEIDKLMKEIQVLNTTKDKFFSVIAQDLRNPFTAVLGFTDILKEDYENIDEKDRILYIRAIHSSSFNIYELLKNLLDWSRTQTGNMECRPALIDMSQLTEQNVQLFSSYARNKEIQLNFEITGEAVTYADRNMVSTVIRNLLNNAIKFTNKGGEVHVAVKDVDHRSELSVTDTGMGISENELKKLFQLGNSKRSKGTADEPGTGLGLILCKEFISINNGTIRAESVPGKGSRFTISLPVRSPESVQ